MDKNNKIWYKDEKEREKVLKDINSDSYTRYAEKINLSIDIVEKEIELAIYALELKYDNITFDNLEAVNKSFAKMWFAKMGISEDKKQDSEDSKTSNYFQQYYAKEVANFTKELEKLNITDSQDLIDILPLIRFCAFSSYLFGKEKMQSLGNEVYKEVVVLVFSSKDGENKDLKDYINEELDKIK